MGKLTAILVLIAIIAGLGSQLRAQRLLQARFLQTDPDSIENDSKLRAFAQSRGRKGFNSHCAGCHGGNLRGDNRRGVPDLTDKDWLYGSGRISELERVVMYGIRSGHSKSLNAASMPAFGTPNPYARTTLQPLTPAQVKDVAALLYSFQHPKSVDAATLARGNAVFHGPGFCYECHADRGQGDPAIGAPDLTDATWLYGDGSEQSIEIAIEKGLQGYCPGWISRLPPEAIRAIAVYVHEAGA